MSRASENRIAQGLGFTRHAQQGPRFGGGGPGGAGGPASRRPAGSSHRNPLGHLGLKQHQSGLPPNLLPLFRARPPAAHLPPPPPVAHALPYTGVGALLARLREAGGVLEPQADDPDEAEEEEAAGVRPAGEGAAPGKAEGRAREDGSRASVRTAAKTAPQRKQARREAQREAGRQRREEALRAWDPKAEAEGKRRTQDPFKTLFVGRLAYDCKESDLAEAFEQYGEVEEVYIVKDGEGKPRGYAFVEYKDAGRMKEAYKRADGLKILGRRVKVDVERGRTVEGWRPARLGGGLGGQSRAPRPKKRRGVPDHLQPPPFGFGDRGGYGDRGFDPRGPPRGGGYGDRGRGRPGVGFDDRRGPPRDYAGGRRDYGRDDDRQRGMEFLDGRDGGGRGRGGGRGEDDEYRRREAQLEEDRRRRLERQERDDDRGRDRDRRDYDRKRRRSRSRDRYTKRGRDGDGGGAREDGEL